MQEDDINFQEEIENLQAQIILLSQIIAELNAKIQENANMLANIKQDM